MTTSCLLLTLSFLPYVHAVINHVIPCLKPSNYFPLHLISNSPNLTRVPPTLQPHLSPLCLPNTPVVRFLLEQATYFPLLGLLHTWYILHPIFLNHCHCPKLSQLWFGCFLSSDYAVSVHSRSFSTRSGEYVPERHLAMSRDVFLVVTIKGMLFVGKGQGWC